MRLACLLLTLTLLTSCAHWTGGAGDDAAFPPLTIPYQRFVLDNGLTVIVHEDRKTPIVAVNVWYHVGSKNETPGRTGFAHLFEHLMFNGSENYNDEFFRPLEAAGATGMNGTTNADRTNYFANVPTPSLDTLLWLESDRMGHLLGAIDQAKLDEQRGVVQNEKRQGENRPYGKVWNLIPGYSYPAGHPYSWSTIGSIEDLNAASLDDVRQWFNDWYGAANAVVVVAGDIDAQSALAKVEAYFGDIPPGPALTRTEAWPAPMAEDRSLVVTDQVPQARSYLVWNVAPNYSADLVALQLAADALAGGKTSRLYQQLVYQDQTATDVSAFILPRELGSQFMVVVTAREGADIAALEQAVLDGVATLAQRKLPAAALDRARTGLYVGLVHGLERVGGFGGKSDILASSEVLGGSPQSWREELDWLRQATPRVVRDAAERWLTQGHLRIRVLPGDSHQTKPSEIDRSRLPAAGTPDALVFPPLQRAQLSNGLRVVLAERHAAPLLEFSLLARGGYSADPAGQEGLANLTMSMLDEGAAGRSALEIATELDELGAQISASATLDDIGVGLSTIKARLGPALALYRQVLTAPDFPQHELDRLKPRVLAGIAQEQADPFQLGLRILPPLLYGDAHPYGVPLTGSGHAASVTALTRDHLWAYYRQHLRPGNAQLLVVGDITLAELLPLLEAEFAGWQDGDAAPVAASVPPVTLPPRPRLYLLDRPDAQQSVILAGHVAPPPSDPDELALSTANTVFGGQFTSRINLNLREDKHWAYGAGSALVNARSQRPFVVYTRVQSDKTVPAIQEIRKELEAIIGKRPITAAELEAVVRQRSLSLPGRNETAGQLAGSIAHILRLDLPDDHYQQLVTGLNAMSLDTARDGARQLIHPEALSWVVVGDVAAMRKELSQLGWGEIVTLQPEQ